MKFIVLFTVVLLCSASMNGQNELMYREKIGGFEYIEVLKGEDNKNLPLLIAFHFSSGNPVQTIADYDSLKNPVRIIVPKGNYPKRDGFSYYPDDYYQKDSITQFAISKKTIDSIAQFVSFIEIKYKKKAIVSGISQGGDIAFMLAKYYPEHCRAAFPFAAVIHTGMIRELNGKPVKKVPIFLFQGENDEIVLVSTTRRKVAEIGNRLNLKLYTYPGLGHDISTQMKIDYSLLIDQMNMGVNTKAIAASK